MRKSSRGNPYHDERGRFCSGPQGKSKYTVSEKTPEEYEQRTKDREKAFQEDTQLVTGIMWDVDSDAEGNALPTEVRVPAGMSEEEISNYLSEEYGFCHEGFVLESDGQCIGPHGAVRESGDKVLMAHGIAVQPEESHLDGTGER